MGLTAEEKRELDVAKVIREGEENLETLRALPKTALNMAMADLFEADLAMVKGNPVASAIYASRGIAHLTRGVVL